MFTAAEMGIPDARLGSEDDARLGSEDEVVWVGLKQRVGGQRGRFGRVRVGVEAVDRRVRPRLLGPTARERSGDRRDDGRGTDGGVRLLDDGMGFWCHDEATS